jgi:hypothetical protein
MIFGFIFPKLNAKYVESEGHIDNKKRSTRYKRAPDRIDELDDYVELLNITKLQFLQRRAEQAGFLVFQILPVKLSDLCAQIEFLFFSFAQRIEWFVVTNPSSISSLHSGHL